MEKNIGQCEVGGTGNIQTPVTSIAGQSPAPQRWRRILRIGLISLAVLIVLLVVVVFYATSEHCLRHIIVPRVAKAIGRDISFGSAKIGLFRGITIGQLTIGPAEGEQDPLLKSSNLAVEWRLGSLLRGRPELRDVSGDGLQVSIVEKPKRPPRETPGDATKKKAPPKGQSSNLQVFVEKLHLTNSSVQWVRAGAGPGGVPARYALRDLDVTGSQLGIGRPAELDLHARVEASDPAQGVKLSDGAVAIKVNSKVQPKSGAFTLDGEWSVSRMKGQFHGVSAADLQASGSLQLEQNDPRRMVIQRADASLSYQGRRGALIALNGEMDPGTGDGVFRVNVRRVNRAFLNLLSTPEQPLDFRDSNADARFVIETSQKAQRTAVEGQLDLTDFSLVAPKIAPTATPLTQMTVRCKTLYDAAQKKLGFDSLEIKAVQEGRDVATAHLSRPITFSLAAGAGGTFATDAAAELTAKVDRLTLAQLNPFLSRQQVRIESGQLSLDSALSVAAGGQAVSARGRLSFADLRAVVADSKVGRTDLESAYDLTFNKGAASIKALSCDVRQDGRAAGHFEGRGEVTPDSQKGEIVLTGDRMDLSALQVFLAEVPSVRVRRGLVNFSQKIVFAGEKAPVQFDGRFDAGGLGFDVPGSERARFADWAVQGQNSVRFDRVKQLADLTNLTLSVEEKGKGRLRATALGQLDLKQGAGSINLNVEEIGVRFLASVLDRLGNRESGSSALPSEGTLTGSAKLKLEKQFADLSVQGNLRTSGVRWAVGGPGAAADTVRDFETTYDLSQLKSNKRNELTIRDFGIRIAGTGAQAGSLRVSGQLDLAKNTGNLGVQFDRFDSEPVLSIAGPLAGAWRPLGGVLNGKETIKFGGSAGELSASGLLRAEQVRILPPKSTKPLAPPTVEVEGAVALLGGGKGFRADRLSIRTFKDNTRTGSLDVSGQLDSAKKEGTLTVNAVNFETDSIWPLLAAMDIDVPITAGRLNGRQALRFASAASMVEAKGSLSADGIRVRPAPGKPAIDPLRLDLTNDLALSADKTDVRQLKLTTYSGSAPLDQLVITAQGGGLRSKSPMNVTFNGPTLHVDPYLAMFSGGKGEPGKSAAPKASGPSGAAPAKAQGGGGRIVIPGPPILAKVGLGKFFYDRVQMESVGSLIAVTSQGVTVKSLTARLADGAASATGWLRTDVPGMTYSATIGGKGLSVGPLLGMISSGADKKLTGKGTTSLVISGRGFDEASIRRDLRGQGTLRITDGEMKDLPILSALAGVTKVGQLADIRFFTFDATWQLAQGVVQIADASAVGQLQKIRAKGQIDFDQKVDLTFDLWLGGELADRLSNKNILKYLKQESDRFLRLPVPIGMGGTLSKPRPTLSLPLDSVLDIGIEQGLKALRDREDRRAKRKK